MNPTSTGAPADALLAHEGRVAGGARSHRLRVRGLDCARRPTGPGGRPSPRRRVRRAARPVRRDDAAADLRDTASGTDGCRERQTRPGSSRSTTARRRHSRPGPIPTSATPTPPTSTSRPIRSGWRWRTSRPSERGHDATVIIHHVMRGDGTDPETTLAFEVGLPDFVDGHPRYHECDGRAPAQRSAPSVSAATPHDETNTTRSHRHVVRRRRCWRHRAVDRNGNVPRRCARRRKSNQWVRGAEGLLVSERLFGVDVTLDVDEQPGQKDSVTAIIEVSGVELPAGVDAYSGGSWELTLKLDWPAGLVPRRGPRWLQIGRPSVFAEDRRTWQGRRDHHAVRRRGRVRRRRGPRERRRSQLRPDHRRGHHGRPSATHGPPPCPLDRQRRRAAPPLTRQPFDPACVCHRQSASPRVGSQRRSRFHCSRNRSGRSAMCSPEDRMASSIAACC